MTLNLSFTDPDTENYNDEFNVTYKESLKNNDSITVKLQQTNNQNNSLKTLLLQNLMPSTAYTIEKIVTLTSEDNKYSDPSNSTEGLTGNLLIYLFSL